MNTTLLRHLLVLTAGLACLSGQAGEVTGFRDNGTGLYPGATPPTTWSPDAGVVWKTALPDWSNSSPLLTGKQLIVCAEPATLIGVSSDTGKILWQNTITNLPNPVPKTHSVNGYTSSTPCSDGRRIWAVFGQGLVGCWDISGKPLWSVSLEKPPHDWGGCVSPRLAGGHVVVQFDNMFGLDPATGAVAWTLKTGWGWGSPVVAKIGGRDILYTCKGAAVDAATGKELTTGLIQLAYNSPCLVEGILYYVQQKSQAYSLPSTPDGKPAPLWNDVTIAGDRYYATPLVHKGLVYAINQSRNLSVLDQKTGALVYQNRVEFLQGTVYPSPTLAGNLIYLSSDGGQTVVIEPGREYREVARNSLEKFRACPVFSGNRMYIRGMKFLWCIGK